MSRRAGLFVVVACVLLAVAGFVFWALWERLPGRAGAGPTLAGVVVHQEGPAGPGAALDERIALLPARPMTGGGLAAATGGLHLRVSSSEPREVLLPIPQVSAGQAPLWYSIRATPSDAVIEYRLRTREEGNVVAAVLLRGGDREVHVSWSAVVLLAPANGAAKTASTEDAAASADASVESYLAATPCVQADAEEIVSLAALLWPASGDASEYAAAIQRHIRAMVKRDQARSLDALEILSSGENGVCTGNANLAAALMRARGIPCRSVAVVPPISQTLEMHRIVEFREGGRWLAFDPSSVQTGVPTRPWQNIVMARTTIADEQVAMRGRAGSMLGCPYGQEAELPGSGVTLAGQDFFWTLARPLARFDPSEDALRLAAEGWRRYLATGVLTQGYLAAASATTAGELTRRLQAAAFEAE